MADIFISYSRKDRTAVVRLAQELEEIGHNVRYDQDYSGGHAWWDAVLRDIQECKIFVYALSQDYLNSYACDLEYKYAHDLGKLILPVMVRPVDLALVPSFIALTNVVTYTDPDKAEQLRSLVRSLNILDRQAVTPLPKPLPPAPPAPISRLNTIIDRIADTQNELALTEQETLLDELRRFYLKAETRENARYVLQRMRQRDDLRSRVVNDIDDLLSLSESGARQLAKQNRAQEKPGSGSSPPQVSPTLLRNIAFLIAILAIVGIVILILASSRANQSANSPTQAVPTNTLHLTDTPFNPDDFVAATIAGRATLTAYAIASYTKTPTMTPSNTHTPTNTPDYNKTIAAAVAATDGKGTANVVASYTKTFTPTASYTPSLTPFPTVSSNKDWKAVVKQFDGVDMVLVPAGCLLMGSNISAYADEKPANKVCFKIPFWIDKTEVTQAQFKRLRGSAAKPSRFTGDNRPVESISWFESRNYCAKRGGRLPTEAEWEYAARGPDNLLYPWGNSFIATNLVYDGNSKDQSANVGSKPGGISWVGALDLSGNVDEWVSTIHDQNKYPYPYNPSDGRENESDTSSSRVQRGGSWGDSNNDGFRSVFRVGRIPSLANSDPVVNSNFGFRCARSFDVAQ